MKLLVIIEGSGCSLDCSLWGPPSPYGALASLASRVEDRVVRADPCNRSSKQIDRFAPPSSLY
jgi:hypothetical protein